MRRVLPVFVGVLGFCVMGCGNPYDGTWLFMLDMASEQSSGTCSAGQNDDWSVTGTSHQIVDIYTYGGDGISVLFQDYLDGTYDGSGFTADYEVRVEWQDEIDISRTEVSALLDGGVLSGTVMQYESEEDTNDFWDCGVEYSFTAERIVSDRNEYVGG